MLTLITGSLGTGKTALAVKLVTEHSCYPDNAVIVGVREWQGGGAFYTLKSQQDAVQNQQLIDSIGKLPGTVYLVDEAKKIWPSRIAGKPEPEFINNHLAESRSIAQDWIITAQAPTQIDVALRRLIGRHIHLELTPFGVKYSESGQVREDLKFTRDESRKYDFPKESLKLYRSDDGVTDSHKKGLRLPKRLMVLLLLVIGMFSMMAYFATQSNILKQFMGSKAAVEEKQDEKEVELKADSLPASRQVQKQSSVQDEKLLPITHAPSIFYYMPRDPSVPELAKAPRLPVSCMANRANGCVCYDQYNQKIVGFPERRCKDILKGENPIAFTLDYRKKNEI